MSYYRSKTWTLLYLLAFRAFHVDIKTNINQQNKIQCNTLSFNTIYYSVSVTEQSAFCPLYGFYLSAVRVFCKEFCVDFMYASVRVCYN